MDRAYSGTCEHSEGSFWDHRHVDDDAIALFDAKFGFEKVGELVDFVVELAVCDDALVTRLTLPDDGRFIFALLQVAVDTLLRDIEFATYEPFVKGGFALIENLSVRLYPVDLFLGEFIPKAFEIALGLLDHLPILLHRVDACTLLDARCGVENGDFGHDLLL